MQQAPLPFSFQLEQLPSTASSASWMRLAQACGGSMLAWDTSGAMACVGLVHPTRGCWHTQHAVQASSCEVLLPSVQALLERAGARLSDVVALTVGLGPGSFTGLRVGLATAKGLTLGQPIQLFGTSSLAMRAAGVGPGLVLVTDNARHDEYFAGLYRMDAQGYLSTVLEDNLWSQAALCQAVQTVRANANMAENLLCIGFEAHQFAERLSATVAQESPYSALALLTAARQDIQTHRTQTAATLLPRYLRLSEPERRLQLQQSKVLSPANPKCCV